MQPMEMALHHHPSHGIEMMTIVPRVAGSEEVVLQLVVGLGGLVLQLVVG